MKNSKQRMLALAIAATMLAVPVSAHAESATIAGAAASGTNPTAVIDPEGGPVTKTEIGTQEITVQSNETGTSNEIVYSVAISWGTMQFTYNYGEYWDPSTKSYRTNAPSGVQGSGWLETNINGENNKIEVTNNSNYPVAIEASFELSANDRFNTNVNGPTAVKGVFNADNDALKAKINTAESYDATASTPASASDAGQGVFTFNLNTSDNSGKYTLPTGLNNVPLSKDFYFGFWGKPDKEKADATMRESGKIKILVKPYGV